MLCKRNIKGNFGKLLHLLEAFGITRYEKIRIPDSYDIHENHYITSLDITEIEGISSHMYEMVEEKALLNELLGDNWAISCNKTLNGIELPVVARNCLENGRSTNIRYEQIVPHKSVLYFIIKTDDENTLELDKEIIQIGANESIGYGYCQITEVV